MTSWSKDDGLSCGFHHILSSVPVVSLCRTLQDSAGLIITTSIHPVFPLRSFWISMWMFSLRSKRLSESLVRFNPSMMSLRGDQETPERACVCVCVFHLSDTFHSDWFGSLGRAFPLFSVLSSLMNTDTISHVPLYDASCRRSITCVGERTVTCEAEVTGSRRTISPRWNIWGFKSFRWWSSLALVTQ